MMHKYLLYAASKAVLLHAKQAERGGRWLTPALQESVVSAMPWLLYPQQRDPVPILQEAGWTSEQVCMGQENLAPLGYKPQTIQPVSSNYTNYTIQAAYVP